MKEFENLSVEQRAAVISGLIAVGVFVVCFLALIFVIAGRFNISDRLKSGSSLFSVMPLIILLLYVFTLLPMTCVYVTTAGILLKRSFFSVLNGVLIILLFGGAGLLLPASVFAVFALTLSNISIYVQAPMTILTIFVCGIAVSKIFMKRKVNDYLKKVL